MFGPDSRLVQGLALLIDVVVVNLLILVCALPLVTAGASLVAGHGALLDLMREEGPGPARGFFSAWRRGWRSGTVGWAIVLSVAALLIWEYWLLGQMTGMGALLAQAAVIAGAVLLGVWTVWFFPLATAGCGFLPTARLAAMLALGRLTRSLFALVLGTAPATLLVTNPAIWPGWLAGMLILGVALALYLADLVLLETLDSVTAPWNN